MPKDFLYPSPIVETKNTSVHKSLNYSEKLKKQREYVAYPEPISLKNIIENTASKDYSEDCVNWWDHQRKLDDEGYTMLAEHYGIDKWKSEPELFHKLLICLARDFVPCFRMDKPRGRPRKNDDYTNALLAVQVRIIMLEDDVSHADAINVLRDSFNLTTRNLVTKGEKIWGNELGENELEKFSVEKLKLYEKTIIDILQLTGRNHKIYKRKEAAL